jgi:hypothetical protein
VNRERIAVWAIAAIAAAASAPASARDEPKPSLSVDPIMARSLLAPVDDGRGQDSSYRLDPGLESASGQRAKLSLEVGESTLFAITGRLSRQPGQPGPLEPGHARALGFKRGETGKVYGAGVSRNIGRVDVSASWQYSRLIGERPGDDRDLRDEGPGKSHSVRASARIRFKH